MSTPTPTAFSHVKPQDTAYRGEGLRDFFLYRDLGIAAATNGKVVAQLVRANHAPEAGTGWNRHEAEFHIVIMLKGWARFMYGDQETLVAAGDCVHQAPGIVHYLFDYSPDMEYLEIVGLPISSRSTSKVRVRCRRRHRGARRGVVAAVLSRASSLRLFVTNRLRGGFSCAFHGGFRANRFPGFTFFRIPNGREAEDPERKERHSSASLR